MLLRTKIVTSIEISRVRTKHFLYPNPSQLSGEREPTRGRVGRLTCLSMNRMAFLGWAAQLLNINHTGGRPYVSRQIRSLNFGIDAEDYGVMRVHLFTEDSTLLAWLQSLPAAQGPLPAIAVPNFYARTTAPRRYYGFAWDHAAGTPYGGEQATVQAFVAWLRPIAQQSVNGPQFPS